VKTQWLGRVSYDDAHALQVQIRDSILAGTGENTLLLLEHDPVITFGRRGPGTDLLVSEDEIARRGIDLRQSERGGQTTYHGLGQVIGYAIARLHDLAPSVPAYIWRLEETMIQTAAAFGVTAERCHCGHGVFVDDKKLGFIGIAVTHGVCWHGVALNVAPNRTHFDLIRPCGLDVEVTALGDYITAPPLPTVAGTLESAMLAQLTQLGSS
jgi:lipoate-protein ligase B